MRITDLPTIIDGLSVERRARFDRIFDVQRVLGECVIPASMRDWTIKRFGSVEAVERQQIVKVTNTITWEGAIFNPLRTRRPLLTRRSDGHSDVFRSDDDIFADPDRTTAIDTYGRVNGEFCTTTSNIARWDGQCSVLIFKNPDPFAFTRAQLRDYFRTTLKWAEEAHKADPAAQYLVWAWNGGTAGGASIPHAHAQMGLSRQTHYAMIEGLRRAALDYRARFGSNYFADLHAAHEDAGLGFVSHGLHGFVNLAAARPKDTWITGPTLDDYMADALYDVLRALIDRANMRGFDVGVAMPPLFGCETCQDSTVETNSDISRLYPVAEDWSGFPVILRIMDRGRPDAMSSDMGAMDFFAHRIIADDPYSAYEVITDKTQPT